MVQWNRNIVLPKSVTRLMLTGAILALVAIVSMPLVAKWSHRNQDEAISKLKALGAMMEFDDDRNVTTLRILNGTSLDALNYLGALPRLQHLHLPLADVGDDDLLRLSNACQLEELILSGNHRISDEGLKNLAPLVNLKLLFLTDVPIDGSGLKYLTRLPMLETLDIALSKLTNPWLEDVARISSLKFLNVATTEITDEGLEHLRPLKNLEHLVVVGTAVTTEAGDKLQKSLPRLQIRYRL